MTASASGTIICDALAVGRLATCRRCRSGRANKGGDRPVREARVFPAVATSEVDDLRFKAAASGVGSPSCLISEPAGPTRVTFVGQGTVLIEMDGVRILTDPVLKRWSGRCDATASCPRRRSGATSTVVLISHLASRSPRHPVAEAAAQVGHPHRARRMSAARSTGSVSRRSRDASRHGRCTSAPSRCRLCTPATRGGAGSSRCRPSRWASSCTVRRPCYFAGDTGLFDGMEDLHERIDLALLPIETWGVRPPEDAI